jgi:uncharacterized protein
MLVVFAAAEVTLLAASVLVLLPFVLADPELSEGRALPVWPLLALLLVPTLAAGPVALAGTALLGGGPKRARVRRELAIRWNLRDIRTGLTIGVGGLLLTFPAAAIWAHWVGGDQANSAVGDAFGGRQLDPVVAVLVFLVVWLGAPLGEEVIFRGVLWRALEHWRWNRWAIFVCTSMVFSVAHLELLRTPLLLILSIPIGLARMLTGNLLAGVAAHQMNNLLPAVALYMATTGIAPT